MHKRDIKAEDASTGLAFIRIYNKWHTKLKKELNNFGITIPQFSVMSVISYLNQSDQFVTQAKISKMADIDVVTVSQVVRGLEKKGFLERFQNPLDSRANAVRLLSKGDEIIKLTFPVVEQSNEAFFGVLAEKEIAFRELLHKLLLKTPPHITKALKKAGFPHTHINCGNLELTPRRRGDLG